MINRFNYLNKIIMENVEKTTNPVTDSVTNLSVIKGVYQAFATGDFPGFLNTMDPNIEWNEA